MGASGCMYLNRVPVHAVATAIASAITCCTTGQSQPNVHAAFHHRHGSRRLELLVEGGSVCHQDVALSATHVAYAS